MFSIQNMYTPEQSPFIVVNAEMGFNINGI
jgi:hypothetical protein